MHDFICFDTVLPAGQNHCHTPHFLPPPFHLRSPCPVRTHPTGGIIYGCFMPAFQIAANDPFRLLAPPTPPLSVYTTFFYFAVGFTLVSGSLNLWLMYRWVVGMRKGRGGGEGGPKGTARDSGQGGGQQQGLFRKLMC